MMEDDRSQEEKTERPLRAGTVTRLVAQKKNPARVSVFVDHAFAFGLHRDVLFAEGIRKGKMLSVEAQQAAVAADQLMAAKQVALNYLSYRSRTSQEVRRKLQRKEFPEAVVETVIARLREMGYLDDAAFARSYAQSRFETKGYGPERVRQELRRRGIPDRDTEAAIHTLLDTADPEEAALEQARKRWARLANETDPRKRRKKLGDFLLRRGFDYSTIRSVTETLEREAS